MESDDVFPWMLALSQGDEQAAALLWERYFEKLAAYARKEFDGLARRDADEEDAALSALNSFCGSMRAGRFPQLNDPNDLWKLLLTFTARKVRAHRRRRFTAKRGKAAVRGESIFLADGKVAPSDAGIGQVLGDEPTPALAVEMIEDCRRLLDALGDEQLQRIALLKLEGFSNQEIAAKLDCVERTVERKLERIRRKWSGATDDLSSSS